MKIVAFLLNQMQITAFKVNTNEKPTSLFKVDTEAKNKGSTFNKELNTAVSSKKPSKVNQDMMLKQEKSLEDYKDQKALQIKKLYSEAQKGVSKPSVLVNTRKSEVASKVESEQNDSETNLSAKAQGIKSNIPEENLSQEENKISANQPDKTNGIEKLDSEKELEISTLTKEDKELTSKLTSNLQDVIAQLAELINLLQAQGTGKEAVTPAGIEPSTLNDMNSKLKDLTSVLTQNLSGKGNPEDLLNSLEDVLNSISSAKLMTGKQTSEATKVDDTFKNLMALTDDKMKVIKNEIADARAIIKNLGGFEKLKNLLSLNNEASLQINETESVSKNTSEINNSATTKNPLTYANEEEKTESPDVLGQTILTNKPIDTKSMKNKSEAETENHLDELTIRNQKNESTETSKTSSDSKQNGEKKFESETKIMDGSSKNTKGADVITNQSSFSSNLKEITDTKAVQKPIPTTTVDKAELLSQIIKKAEVIVGATQSEMIMKLEPENLGKLNLRVSVERGLLTASFQAENQQVKSIIESNFNSLRDMLQEKGINVQSINVSLNQQNSNEQKWNTPTNWDKNSGSRTSRTKEISSNSISYLNTNIAAVDNSRLNPYTRHLGKLDIKG